MKKIIYTLFICLFCQSMIGQVNLPDEVNAVKKENPERSETLNQLYEQAKYLENNGTPLEINQNRVAIKNEWQTIDPEIAALYKQVTNGGKLPETEENVGFNGVVYPSEIRERGEVVQQRDWDSDRLIRDLWVDGVDMDVTASGDIYISSYVNYISTGGTRDSISIYRSINGGGSFQQWKRVAVTASVEKLQLVSFDGTGDDYVVAYLLTDSETFQAWRWNVTTGDFEAQTIATSISDFGVDRNYSSITATQRAFATYQKFTSCQEVYSARSTAASYGFDWVDEVSESGTCGSQVEFAYGRGGATYTTYTGENTGNLYANANDNFNDPASWETRETVTTGAVREILNPRIAAARKFIENDEVLIIASARDAGTLDNYDLFSQLRENGGGYSLLWIGISFPEDNAAHYDTWVRKVNNTEEIRTGSLQDKIDNTSNDICWLRTYDGTAFTGLALVSDHLTNDVWDGFPPAVAETNDNLACMAFAGTREGFGYGLYFDSEADIVLNTQNNAIEGMSYYPNPTSETLTVKASQTIEKVELFSISGKKVKEFTPNLVQATLNIQELTSGVYIMTIHSNKQTANYKVIKN